MNDLKYVILIPPGMNQKGARAIIFNGVFNHKDIATLHITKRFKLHSAGFCSIVGEKIITWGSSESLKIGSKQGDQDIILRTLQMNHTITDINAYE